MSVKAYTTKLQFHESGAYTDLARVVSIKPPKISAKDIDTTTLESADEFEEMIAGLASGGELEATIQYDKTVTATLYALFRVAAGYRIKYPDGSGWTYAGYLNEIGEEEIVNGEIVTQTIKIKITGKPVPSASLAIS